MEIQHKKNELWEPESFSNSAVPNAVKTSHRRGGRPRLSAVHRRVYPIKVSFSEYELARLEKRAAAAGNENLADFLRRLGLGGQVAAIPAINRQALAELGRIGSNINQVARELNSGNETAETLAVIAELQKKLDEVGAALAGEGVR